MINHRDQALHVFDFVPVAKSACDRGPGAGLLKLGNGGPDAFHGDPVSAANVVEQRPPSSELRELPILIADNDAGAGSANDQHAGPAKRCALKGGDGVTHEAGPFPGMDFSAELFLLLGCGLVEDAGCGNGVMGEFVGEGELKLEVAEDFAYAPTDLLLVGAGEVHRRGVDDREHPAVVCCRHAVAVSGTTINPDDQLQRSLHACGLAGAWPSAAWETVANLAPEGNPDMPARGRPGRAT